MHGHPGGGRGLAVPASIWAGTGLHANPVQAGLQEAGHVVQSRHVVSDPEEPTGHHHPTERLPVCHEWSVRPSPLTELYRGGPRPVATARAPRGRGRSDGSQTGLLQRDLVTWSPHGWDAAPVDRAGQVRRGQDSRPSPHPPGTRTRVTLGRNACLLRAAGGRDKTTRERARGLGARPRRTPRPGSPPGLRTTARSEPRHRRDEHAGEEKQGPRAPGRERTPVTQRTHAAVAWVA